MIHVFQAGITGLKLLTSLARQELPVGQMNSAMQIEFLLQHTLWVYEYPTSIGTNLQRICQ